MKATVEIGKIADQVNESKREAEMMSKVLDFAKSLTGKHEVGRLFLPPPLLPYPPLISSLTPIIVEFDREREKADQGGDVQQRIEGRDMPVLVQ